MPPAASSNTPWWSQARDIFKDEHSSDLLPRGRTAGRDGKAVGPENVALVLDLRRYGPAGRTATVHADRLGESRVPHPGGRQGSHPDVFQPRRRHGALAARCDQPAHQRPDPLNQCLLLQLAGDRWPVHERNRSSTVPPHGELLIRTHAALCCISAKK
jgi:hypothetical protein